MQLILESDDWNVNISIFPTQSVPFSFAHHQKSDLDEHLTRAMGLVLARAGVVRDSADTEAAGLVDLHAALASDVDAAVADVSAHLVAMQTKHLAHQSRDLDAATQRAEALHRDAHALRTTQERDVEGKDLQIQTLKAALEDARVVTTRATAALEEHVAMETAATEDLRKKHTAHAKAHAEAVATLQGELEVQAKSTRDAQMKVFFRTVCWESKH